MPPLSLCIQVCCIVFSINEVFSFVEKINRLRNAFTIVLRQSQIVNIHRLPKLQSHVDVYDNVVCAENLLKAHSVSKIGGLGHTVFDRKSTSPRTSVETLIDTILNNVNDESRYAEYWWRDEWINLDAHADIDENLAKEDTSVPYRYPESGHVLYLQIGPSVEGPTLLLLNNYTSLISIPAVNGRLLRFNGTTVHAVPRPALAYIDEEEGGTNHEIFSRIRRIDGEESDETTIYLRSVLLFNTWNGPTPPYKVETTISNKVKSYENIEVSKTCQCNPMTVWLKQPLLPVTNGGLIDENDQIRIKMGLLGDKIRRGRTSRYIELLGHKQVKIALKSKKDVYITPIKEKESILPFSL